MNKFSVTIVSAIALTMAMPLLAQDMEDTITVTSSIFDHHGMVPEENSAYGANTSIDLIFFPGIFFLIFIGSTYSLSKSISLDVSSSKKW